MQQQRGLALKFASDSLKNDKEVVLAAVQQDGWALQYMLQMRLRMIKIQQDDYALAYASDALKNDPIVAMAAVKQKSQEELKKLCWLLWRIMVWRFYMRCA